MSLIEVTVAMALFTVAAVAASHLIVWATRALWAGGAETIATVSAQSRMEELHALAWRFDGAGNRVSDPRLTPSPANALTANLAGYADYLDREGRSVGAGADPPAAAAFVRRWSIRPMAVAPEDSLVLQVLVVPLANGPAASRGSAGRGPGEALLISARTRLR
jgi:hypothetical protein